MLFNKNMAMMYYVLIIKHPYAQRARDFDSCEVKIEKEMKLQLTTIFF